MSSYMKYKYNYRTQKTRKVKKKLKTTVKNKRKKTRICAAEMAVRYAALAEKYMCVIVIR